MRQVPKVYSAVEIKNYEQEFKPEDAWKRVKIDGVWLPTRPLGLMGIHFIRRLKIAYKVFVGQYDAIDWLSGKGLK